jgi:hypothetical protein
MTLLDEMVSVAAIMSGVRTREPPRRYVGLVLAVALICLCFAAVTEAKTER